MEKRGLTQQKVADAAGVSRIAVLKWRKGAIPNAADLNSFAKSQSLPVEWFFGGGEIGFGVEINLTETESLSKNVSVKSPLPAFLERVRKAASAPGKKTELADFLGAPLASVSRWLKVNGGREPGAEVTLKMLQWVQEQERQKQKSPGGV